ncbi:hypothetical protein C8R45DRAFT_1223326, partial [Mycena sanguinolenta]
MTALRRDVRAVFRGMCGAGASAFPSSRAFFSLMSVRVRLQVPPAPPARQLDVRTAEHEHEWHHRRAAAFASVFYVWAWFVCSTAPASVSSGGGGGIFD